MNTVHMHAHVHTCTHAHTQKQVHKRLNITNADEDAGARECVIGGNIN